MIRLADWTARPRPGGDVLSGKHVRLEPLDWDAHHEGLYAATGGAENAALWDYIPFGPFTDADTLRQHMSFIIEAHDWACMVIRAAGTGTILGMASYMRLRPEHGSAEVGCVIFGHDLQRTRAATEAMALMAGHLFETLGYRRYEWKCDNANAASRRAALRLGFQFEGIFRNDMVVKGRNRDTAWFAMTDSDWPRIKAGYEAWLSDDNFTADGQQRRSLGHGLINRNKMVCANLLE